MLPITPQPVPLADADKILPKITKLKIRILENSTVLTIGEKVELLLLLLHKKWIAEVDIGLSRRDASLAEIRKLELPYRTESRNGDFQESWIQVGANQAVLNYVKARHDQLSELEAGILYGFPVTHVLGYIGVIQEKVTPPRDEAMYMLAGVYSKAHYNEELAQFHKIWDEVERVSPVIAMESRDKFIEMRDKYTKKL
ncbi:hypothetical protein JNJ66_00885 [Candidatus Saccharibacteria bacterium]|nr:hypothetical protein [Candidatus Saccharibacteria bacterium]